MVVRPSELTRAASRGEYANASLSGIGWEWVAMGCLRSCWERRPIIVDGAVLRPIPFQVGEGLPYLVGARWRLLGENDRTEGHQDNRPNCLVFFLKPFLKSAMR